jgi:endonuclease YncB( thermonuclease family)
MLKPCPKCKKLSHVETRICTCGFWFIENKLAETSADLRQTKKEKLKKSVVKFLVLTSFVIFVCLAVAILGGFTDFFRSSENDKENSALDDLPGKSKNISSTSRFPKGRIEGKVVAVNSGDMITILDGNNQEYKIRLGGIDAPDPEQNFGQQSKENLAALVLDKNVLVNLQKIDEGGQIVGKVLLDTKDINLEQIKAGFAGNNKNSANEQSEDDRQLYAEAENAAKTAGTGLWANIKTDAAEVPNETPFSSTNNEPASVNKTAPTPETDSSPAVKGATSESRTEIEIPADLATITPVPTPAPSSTVITPPTPKITTNTENTESKTAGKSVSAIARCADGTLSYSLSRSGACSNHGGVSGWLAGSNSPAPTKPSERAYIRGSRGGCYYLSPSGKKTYVDQSLCNQP